ncbi:hypothetical protein ACFCX4_00330 [Kitasatospora sp. NPDC056327]
MTTLPLLLVSVLPMDADRARAVEAVLNVLPRLVPVLGRRRSRRSGN